MSHPQIEEVSDSDPEEMDPSDFLPSDSGPAIAPMEAESSTTSVLPHRPPPAAAPAASSGFAAPSGPTAEERAARQKESKTWHALYPVYFDATRTRAEGRRVPRAHAVKNPLAFDIAQAVASLGTDPFLEAMKIHPKDWANPGRVKVRIRDEEGKPTTSVQNKRHLYILVSKFLRDNPTTEKSPLRLQVPGLPNPKVVPPAVPKGWKIGSILPLHSDAVTGGGVSENMFKDMMAEMQEAGGAEALAAQAGGGGIPAGLLEAMGAAGGGGDGGGSGGGAAKKEKKEKKEKKKGR